MCEFTKREKIPATKRTTNPSSFNSRNLTSCIEHYKLCKKHFVHLDLLIKRTIWSFPSKGASSPPAHLEIFSVGASESSESVSMSPAPQANHRLESGLFVSGRLQVATALVWILMFCAALRRDQGGFDITRDMLSCCWLSLQSHTDPDAWTSETPPMEDDKHCENKWKGREPFGCLHRIELCWSLLYTSL